jgi:hypothetical protein
MLCAYSFVVCFFLFCGENSFWRYLSKRTVLNIIRLFALLKLSFLVYAVHSDALATASGLDFNESIMDIAIWPSEVFYYDITSSRIEYVVIVEGLEWREFRQSVSEDYEFVVLGDSHTRSSTSPFNIYFLQLSLHPSAVIN